jgi:hypothetical protein
MTVPYYISENKSDMRGIKHGRYAIEDDGNLSDRRGTRVGSRLRRPAYVLPAVIFEFFGSVNWTGKSERRAECLYLQPLHPSSSADILSQLTDRVRRALVASALCVRRGVRAVNQAAGPAVLTQNSESQRNPGVSLGFSVLSRDTASISRTSSARLVEINAFRWPE